MDDKLAHLSKTQIEELIERYYNKEKVKSLIEEYEINARPSQLVKLFPPIVTKDVCPYCNVNLVIRHSSRDYHWSNRSATCPSCGHEENGLCWCTNCKEKEQLRAQIESQEKQELLNLLLHIDEDEKVDLDSVSFEDKIYLGAFLREGISEDFNFIRPIDSFDNPLAPTQEYASEVLEALRKKRLVIVHPDSDSEYFEDIDIEARTFRFYPDKVKWALNLKKEGLNKVPLVDSLINPNYDVEPEESYQIWRRISLHEALEYFYHSVINVLGVEYSPGEKTIAVLNDLLNDYSVSQIYTIIYRSTNNALRFQVEQGVSRKHASNTIVGNAQNFAERAKVKKWDVQRYHRLRELPESALSKFFFERILKIGYAGFNEKPRLILTKENDKSNDQF